MPPPPVAPAGHNSFLGAVMIRRHSTDGDEDAGWQAVLVAHRHEESGDSRCHGVEKRRVRKDGEVRLDKRTV
jgi:hypothetical protein